MEDEELIYSDVKCQSGQDFQCSQYSDKTRAEVLGDTAVEIYIRSG